MAAREQFGVRGKQFLHLGRGTKMVISPEPLLWMLLTKQGQGADALDDVILPAVGRKFVMNRKGSEAGQGSRPFFELLEAMHFKIKTIGKKPGQLSAGTERNEAIGVFEHFQARLNILVPRLP